MEVWRRYVAFGAVAFALIAGEACHRKPLLWIPAPIANGTPGSKDFTVVWDGLDYNGSPIDPWWSHHPTLPPRPGDCGKRPDHSDCTDQRTVLDLAEPPNAFVCNAELRSKLHGHVNWTPATAFGKVLWMGLATDGDINLKLFPREGRGMTSNNEESPLLNGANGRYLEVEFSSSETLENFTSQWWTDLFRLAKQDKKKFDRIDPLLNPQRPGTASNAVIYGLFGLDCEHSCRSEYHPVYAMAIEVDDRPDQNTWAIVVRNWGNEGFCGRLNHELYTPDNKIRLTLPRSGARPELVKAVTEFRATSKRIPFPDVAFETSAQNVVLTFTVPEPRVRVNGEMLLRLRWPGGFKNIPPDFTRAPVSPGAFFDAGLEEPEDYLERVVGARTKLQEQLDTQPAFRAADEKTQLLDTPDLGALADFVVPPGVKKPATSRLAVDQEKLEADKARWRAICAAYAAEQQRDFPKLPEYKNRDISEVCRLVR